MMSSLRRMAMPAGIAVAIVAVTLGVLGKYGKALRPESYVFFSLISLAFTLTVVMAFRSLRVLADGSSEVVEEEAAGSLEELEVEKRRLLAALKELEFDLGMEKISRSDYDELCAFYERRAIEVMRLIDESRAQAGPGPTASDVDDGRAARRERKKARKKAHRAERAAAAAPAAAVATTTAGQPREGAWRERAERLLAERIASRDAALANGTHANGAGAAAPPAAAVAPAPSPSAVEVATAAPTAAVPESIAPPAACVSCGTGLDADSLFCKRCGTRVTAAPAAAAAKETHS